MIVDEGTSINGSNFRQELDESTNEMVLFVEGVEVVRCENVRQQMQNIMSPAKAKYLKRPIEKPDTPADKPKRKKKAKGELGHGN